MRWMCFSGFDPPITMISDVGLPPIPNTERRPTDLPPARFWWNYLCRSSSPADCPFGQLLFEIVRLPDNSLRDANALLAW
jgi:hypothetical protein